MDDIFSKVRDGNSLNVRIWLDNTENDLNEADDHQQSLLHWACFEGHVNIVDMLITRGARTSATNMGDDTPLHVAASRGHREVVLLLLQKKVNVSAANEHGNTALHYACFWGYEAIAEDLVNNGAFVSVSNRFDETPLDKAKHSLAAYLRDKAHQLGQDVTKIPYDDRGWGTTFKTRTNATLSRNFGLDMKQLNLQGRISNNHSGDIWRGMWQGNDIVAKILNVKQCTMRMARDFSEEFPRLRIFNHANILAVLAASSQPPHLVMISQYMNLGSLYHILHGAQTDIVVDVHQALKFAVHIAKGMEFLHSMEPVIPNLAINSKHILIDNDFTARINMADYKFSFHERHKEYSPAWMSPEALQRRAEDINVRSADMWSFSILLWELTTREVPFSDLSPMEVGMKVALEDLRVTIPPGTSSHLSKLMRICMNEDSTKRPRFDAIIPILDKIHADYTSTR